MAQSGASVSAALRQVGLDAGKPGLREVVASAAGDDRRVHAALLAGPDTWIAACDVAVGGGGRWKAGKERGGRQCWWRSLSRPATSLGGNVRVARVAAAAGSVPSKQPSPGASVDLVGDALLSLAGGHQHATLEVDDELDASLRDALAELLAPLCDTGALTIQSRTGPSEPTPPVPLLIAPQFYALDALTYQARLLLLRAAHADLGGDGGLPKTTVYVERGWPQRETFEHILSGWGLPPSELIDWTELDGRGLDELVEHVEQELVGVGRLCVLVDPLTDELSSPDQVDARLLELPVAELFVNVGPEDGRGAAASGAPARTNQGPIQIPAELGDGDVRTLLRGPLLPYVWPVSALAPQQVVARLKAGRRVGLVKGAWAGVRAAFQ